MSFINWIMHQNWRRTIISYRLQKGYYVKEANDTEHISLFNSIYKANMLRLDASRTYLFSDQYIIDLPNSPELDARLLFVHNAKGFSICGAIVVFTKNLIQAHLLATRPEYYSESPAKLLTDEITILGRKLGMKYFNLGGGLGFKEDSLFDWKSTFSKVTFNYSSWRFVANQQEYNHILNIFDVKPNSTTDLFPLYRSNFQPFKLQEEVNA